MSQTESLQKQQDPVLPTHLEKRPPLLAAWLCPSAPSSCRQRIGVGARLNCRISYSFRKLEPSYCCGSNLSHTNKWPSISCSQTLEHIQQNYPLYRDVRRQSWPEEGELLEKLWGLAAALRKTADFILRTGRTI